MSAAGLDQFATKFSESDDPWLTFTDRDEAMKRRAILRALGPGPIGRVLELAAGNGSNSAAIAPRALRLDATEGTQEGTQLTAEAIAPWHRARALRLALPAPFPRPLYDVVVIAELLYYLSPRDMRAVAEAIARALRPGGTLVLAHHRIDYYDFAQHAGGIHERFLGGMRSRTNCRIVRRTGRWIVAVVKLTE
ncbi:class I SAM-dependent methyltransferase [uncultured Sphingomonas sp.]|uniref:class I SAM-dependent methyltransferase n=1 Tax=uncultured Sphingomonas sp. TaxID=158754 RepID=UPI0035CB360B